MRFAGAGQVLTADKGSYIVVWKGGERMAKAFRQAARVLPDGLRGLAERLPAVLQAQICEIRLRVDAPVMLTTAGTPFFLTQDADVTRRRTAQTLVAREKDVQDTFLRACDYSVLRREPEIRQGFLTLEGGHRLGIAGAHGAGNGFERVTSLNLRVARSIPDAADALGSRLFADGLCSPVLAGPPLCGKTTILRALAAGLAEGRWGQPYRVSVVDSRREFGTLPSCDVLTGFDQAQGVHMALRSLSPQMVICDEVTTAAQASALEAGFSAGAACAVSVHAADADALHKRIPLLRLLETGQFTHIVLLAADAPGRVARITDVRETRL